MQRGASEDAVRFSVIIPCRDDQQHLSTALGSVLGQTVQDVEVIVVDDGSDPPLVVPRDPRVRLVRRSHAGGPAAARNAGLAVATGEFVAWCDSDDVFTPDRLALAVELHRHADVAVVGQGTLGSQRPRKARVPRNLADVTRGVTPHLGATSVRRSICPPLDEHYLACQDVEWWVRLVALGPSFASCSEVGYLFRRSDRERMLNSPSARLEFSYELLVDHRHHFERDRRARAFRWYRIAVMERRHGSHGLAARAIRQSVRARPSLRWPPRAPGWRGRSWSADANRTRSALPVSRRSALNGPLCSNRSGSAPRNPARCAVGGSPTWSCRHQHGCLGG